VECHKNSKVRKNGPLIARRKCGAVRIRKNCANLDGFLRNS
jgi:hypothetical protein